jgi:hypothetical protein
MTVFRRKRCRLCGEEKVVSRCNFYRWKTTADGFDTRCIPCARREINENRELKADYYRAYDRARRRLPHRLAANLAWKRSPAGKESARRSNRLFIKFKTLEART